MKYLPFLWSTLWRKKTRTIFTLLSIVFAFLLYGILGTLNHAFENPSAGVNGADKLITTNKFSITLQLPYSFAQQIAAVPGVSAVTWLTWFGAYYQESKNFVFAIPIDMDSYFKVYKTDFIISDEHMKAFANTRSGALVNSALMSKFGWKVGDKLPLHSTIWTQKSDGSLNWSFDIVGTFDAADPTVAQAQSSTVLFHYDLFDEARSFAHGEVGWFEERIADPLQSDAIADKIDALFANSPNETRTQPAKDFAKQFIKQFGDIGFILRAILGAVFFTLLFLTGNTMMQSVRERVPELAVLKTLGFSDAKVLMLVLGESLLLCVLAAIAGLGLSYLLIPAIQRAMGGMDLLSHEVQPSGLAVAVLLALLVGAPPAIRAMRLNVVDALMDKR
jgi:putative ABC transport system permease protein